MATTTYSAILTAFRAAVEARTPLVHTGVRFRRYAGDEPSFTTWCLSMGEGAFRVFELRHLHDTIGVGPFDLLAYTCEATIEVAVAYPLVSLRYGAADDTLGDVLIDADRRAVIKAIGQAAVSASPAVWPDGMTDCKWVATGVEDLGQTRLLRVQFRIDYQETNPS